MLPPDKTPSLVEPFSGKAASNILELAETSGIPAGVIRDALAELLRSQIQLCERAAALQTQNKELKAYAHMVAHDLKDPLAALVVTSDLLTDVPDLTEAELKEYVGQIKSTAYEMDNIVHNLLLFAEVGTAGAPLGPLNMECIVAGVLERLSYMVKEYQARVEIPPDWPAALGFAPWIEEVWANYLSNAIKYGGRPPQVQLGFSPMPDGMLRFWALDNGPGIPPEAQTCLFTPSSQAGCARKTGHGLGLLIVASIVEKLGGQVGVESEVGKGSLFFFTLPAAPTPS